MVVHWLTFQRPMKWVWIESQVRELRFHLPRGQKKKKMMQKYCNKFNKDFKNGPCEENLFKK